MSGISTGPVLDKVEVNFKGKKKTKLQSKASMIMTLGTNYGLDYLEKFDKKVKKQEVENPGPPPIFIFHASKEDVRRLIIRAMNIDA